MTPIQAGPNPQEAGAVLDIYNEPMKVDEAISTQIILTL